MKPTVTRYEVTVITENDKGKSYMSVAQLDSLLGVVRYLHGYKTKRGYRIVYSMFEEKEYLI